MNYPNRKLVTQCSVCGVSKKEANHWHELHTVHTAQFHAIIFATGVIPTAIAGDIAEVYDVCGENCLHRKIDQLRGVTREIEREGETL